VICCRDVLAVDLMQRQRLKRRKFISLLAGAMLPMAAPFAVFA